MKMDNDHIHMKHDTIADNMIVIIPWNLSNESQTKIDSFQLDRYLQLTGKETIFFVKRKNPHFF